MGDAKIHQEPVEGAHTGAGSWQGPVDLQTAAVSWWDLWCCKGPRVEQAVLEGLQPVKGTYIVTLVGDPPLEQLSPEELHPMEGTQDGVDCE